MARGPWKKSVRSKHALAGEPVAQFLRREAGSRGCWLCRGRASADTLRSQLFSAAKRLGRRIGTEMIPAADLDGNGYMLLVATIKHEQGEEEEK